MRTIRYNGNILTFAGKILRMAEWVYQEGIHYLRVLAGGGVTKDRNLAEDIYRMEEEYSFPTTLVGVLPESGRVERASGIYRFVSKLFSLWPQTQVAKRNLLTYTEKFANDIWIKSRITASVSNTEQSPSGRMTANLLLETNTTGFHILSYNNVVFSANSFTYSVYVKANGRTLFSVGAANTSVWDANASFDLIAITATATHGSATITSVGNGWYYITLSGIGASGTTNINSLVIIDDSGNVSYTGDSSKGFYYWGAQLEQSSTASAYQFVIDSGSWDGVLTDVTQSTANSQPYLFKKGIKNPNGGSRFMTHPTVTFTGSDNWTLSAVINWNGTVNAIAGIFGKGSDTASLISLRLASNNRFSIINESATTVSGAIGANNRIIGKRTLLHFVANGTSIAIYAGSTLIETLTVNTNIVLSSIIKAYSTASRDFHGNINYYFVRSGWLDATQRTAEYNLLSSYFPEISTVQVGSKHIATDNCEMVATPKGNVITLVNTPATWADAQNIYNTTYAATSGTVTQKTLAALKAAAMWRSPDSDLDKQAVFWKIYNKYAAKLFKVDIDTYNAENPTETWGYHVMTRSEAQALDALGANSLKATETDQWTTANGTNTTGLDIYGAGVINANGTYTDFKGKARLMTDDDYALDINDDGTSAEIAVTTEGGSLRLVKD